MRRSRGLSRGNGTIVNISSIVAIAPEVLNGVYGGSKAFVLAFSHSLVHELADKGIRVQAVLPGATATEFWDVAGVPVHQLPAQIVMSADDMVDAALARSRDMTVSHVPAEIEVEWSSLSGSLSTRFRAPPGASLQLGRHESVSTGRHAQVQPNIQRPFTLKTRSPCIRYHSAPDTVPDTGPISRSRDHAEHLFVYRAADRRASLYVSLAIIYAWFGGMKFPRMRPRARAAGENEPS